MSRRGQRSRYINNDDDQDGWQRTSTQRRVNGDYSSSLNASSMTRELDDLMRIIEADWNVVTTSNVCPATSFKKVCVDDSAVLSCGNGHATHGSKFSRTRLQCLQNFVQQN